MGNGTRDRWTLTEKGSSRSTLYLSFFLALSVFLNLDACCKQAEQATQDRIALTRGVRRREALG